MVILLACAGAPSEPIDTDLVDTDVADTSGADTADTTDTDDTAPETGDTGPGPDRDGDGTPDADDCGPDDPWTYPGAEEWCDLLDHDCDGDPLPEGVCQKMQDVRAIDNVELPYEGILHHFPVLPDLDANGIDEVAILDGNTFQLRLITDGFHEDADLASLASRSLLLDGGGDEVFGLDFNGDGEGDVLTVQLGTAYRGNAFILPGPIADWTDGSTVRTEASVGWEELAYADSFGGSVTVGELTGDGRDDAIITAWNSDELTAFLLVGRDDVGGVLDLAEETAHTGAMMETVAVVGDLDGDGLDDFVHSDDGLIVHLAADITVGAHEDWGLSEISVTPLPDQTCGETGRASAIGDWTGDGFPDVLGYCQEPDFSVILTFLDGARLSGPVSTEDASLGSLIHSGTAWTGSLHRSPELAADLDNDGLRDLFVYGTTETAFAHPLLSSDGVPGPNTDPAENDRGWGLTTDFDYLTLYSGELDGREGVDLLAMGYYWLEDLDREYANYVVHGMTLDWNALP